MTTPLDASINGLRWQTPRFSAYSTVSRGQRAVLAGLVLLIAIALMLRPFESAIALNAILTVVYVAVLVYKFLLVRQALRSTSLVTVGDADAGAVPASELPRYTVMVPAYREADVLPRTIQALERLDYPHELLDIKLLLEEDDDASISSVARSHLPTHMTVVIVPAVGPRTKPKACNYGLQFATGELVTIYDAEDRPEPLQLRRAAVAFQRLDGSIGCLQAMLDYYNPEQNLITRWFTVEYATWFSVILPALAEQGGPVPLGGTSMHVRRGVLEQVGAWDPYNVTEDADLGVRLHRFGYRTLVLDSTTFEEANSDFVNWVKQRSRWYKGYLQTFLVHLRQPFSRRRELGLRGFVAFTLLVPATPIVALINPIYWFLTLLWFVAKPVAVSALFPRWLYFPALTCLVLGNFFVVYVSLIVIRLTDRVNLLGAVVLMPLYWLMMSIAALKAMLQLVINPWYWEKTTHGLDHQPGSRGSVKVSDG